MKALLISMLAAFFDLQAEELLVNCCKDPQKTAEWEKNLLAPRAGSLFIKLYASDSAI